MARTIQPSFAKGEISPALYGRVDTQAYGVALRQARNLIIHPYGGASSRDGQRYLEPVKNHDETQRLIPFSFKTTDEYMLEFGNLYMRVMRDGGHVLDTDTAVAIADITNADPGVVETTGAHGYATGEEVYIQNVVGMTEVNGRRYTITVTDGTHYELTSQIDGTDVDTTNFGVYSSGGTGTLIFEITTPYAEADLMEMTYVQSADVMTLCHKNYAVYELTRLDHDDWTITEAAFEPDILYTTGVAVTANTTGSVTERYQVTAIGEDGEESLVSLNDDPQGITGISKAVEAVVDITSHPYIQGDIIEFSDAVGGMVEIHFTRAEVVSPVNANDFAIDLDTTSYTTYTSGGTTSAVFKEITNGADPVDNTITWVAEAEAVRYAVYRRDNGLYGILGETELLTFKDADIAPDVSETPPTGENPFALGNNPGAVTFYEQRRVFGGSDADPDTSWFSQTGRINNFSSRTPTVADDAITASLVSRQVNEIRQYVPSNDLLVFTSGSEWKVSSGPDSVLAPDTIQQKPQTAYGSSFLPPIEFGQTVMFITPEVNQVRSFGFSLQLDGYTGSDMMIFSEHMLEDDTIRDWTNTLSPEDRIHLVLGSGKALTFTFDQEQEVLAWSTWDTDGFYETCASLRGESAQGADSVYYVVRRTIDGTTRRYIEAWQQRYFGTVEDAFFVDSGVTWDDPQTVESFTLADPIVFTDTAHGLEDGDFVDFEEFVWESDFDEHFNETQPDQLNGYRYTVANKTNDTFEITNADGDAINGSTYNAWISGGVYRLAIGGLTGLDHLEGESVVALNDGNVVSSLVVTDGAVTFARDASRVQIGLRYIADLETLDVESPQGTTQGQLKHIPRVTVRFRRSRGLLIGPSSDKLQEMKQREFEVMGEPTALLTGDKLIDIKPDWNSNGRVFLRQKDPLPLTILAIIPIVEIGDPD